MAVPCVSVSQRWLKRPPEGEKKRGDTTGEGDKERREPLAEVRARDRRERELETNELGFRRYGAAWGRWLI